MYRVLLVEQTQVCRELTHMVNWKALGFDTVLCEESFSQALDTALVRKPHVAIIGRTLGDRMGYDLVDRFRELGLKTVCCLVSTQFDIHDARRAMRSGCRELLLWPAEASTLREFLKWAEKELRGQSGRTGMGSGAQDPVLKAEPGSYSSVTGRILQAVYSDFRHSISLTSIARAYNMSSKYMGRVFLKDTGMRFTEYLMAYRMLEAKRLILSSNEKISVISGMVGYSQQNNFYTHFHQYFGVSPGSLRNVQSLEEVSV